MHPLRTRVIAGCDILSALEGERKQTLLFADTKGSMELLADCDRGDPNESLDPVLENLTGAVLGMRAPS